MAQPQTVRRRAQPPADALSSTETMRTVLAYPGNMAEAQHGALALAEADALQAFVTTFA